MNSDLKSMLLQFVALIMVALPLIATFVLILVKTSRDGFGRCSEPPHRKKRQFSHQSII